METSYLGGPHIAEVKTCKGVIFGFKTDFQTFRRDSSSSADLQDGADSTILKISKACWRVVKILPTRTLHFQTAVRWLQKLVLKRRVFG